MVGFFIALLSGALMSIQGVFNTEVTKTTGMWVGNAWVQLTAFAVCLIAWLIAGRDNPMVLMKVEPRYLLLGGVIGAGITLTVIRAMNQLVAYGIELLGLFGVDKEPLEWRKVIGMGIALIGIAIFQWK